MSKGRSKADGSEPPRGGPSSDRSAIVVGADDVARDVATALADRSVAVSRYEDPIVALKGHDAANVDCVVVSAPYRGVNRILDRIASEETVVVRLDGDADTEDGDLVVSSLEDPETIADRIVDALEDHAVDRHLARHDRLLRAVHDVTQAALEGNDFGGICEETCDRLFESDCYAVVWITREQDGDVVVEATAGIEPNVLAVDSQRTATATERDRAEGTSERERSERTSELERSERTSELERSERTSELEGADEVADPTSADRGAVRPRTDGAAQETRTDGATKGRPGDGTGGDLTTTQSAGYQTATVPLVADGDRQGTLGLSTDTRIDAAEREVLSDLGTVLGERLASAETVVPPTPGEYGFGSEEAARTAMQAVQNVELPPAFAEIVDDYEDVFGRRDRFLWQWLHTVFPLFELSCIDDESLETVRTAKLATSMLVVVLDDLGESPEHYETFQEAATVPFDHQSANVDREAVDPEPVAFIEDVWDVIVDTLESAPLYEEYAETFRFDLRQVVSAIEYAHHLNEHPRVGNVLEAEAYGSHNMMMFPAADIDLMYAPSFDRGELPDLRSAIYDAQKMGRIGNWLSTWERELAEGDVHAGTVLQALAADAIELADLERVGDDDALRERVVDRIQESESESVLLKRWEDHYRRIHRRTGDFETVDLSAFLSGMVEVFRYHRASRGLK